MIEPTAYLGFWFIGFGSGALIGWLLSILMLLRDEQAQAPK